jgi:DNA adenine methylase
MQVIRGLQLTPPTRSSCELTTGTAAPAFAGLGYTDGRMTGVVAERASLRPPLKWAGGKRWQVPHLRPLWAAHRHRRLVEPFCGGLAIALGLRPETALLNDSNAHLIEFYRWLQRGLTIDLALRNEERHFYRRRERFNALLRAGKSASREAASLFYYLNRTGYNGLCRFNQQDQFNVPFGRYRTIRYVDDFSSYAPALAAWEFVSTDFEALDLRPDDFVYADPPYDVEFTQYARDRFSWEDQERAAVFFAAHPGPVVLVNQATPRIERLYRRLKYQVTFLDAPRRISCTGDRTPAGEILATRHL